MVEDIIIDKQAVCNSCSRCIKQCAVKSIHHNGNQAYINSKACLTCGICVDACPNGYISFRNDIDYVKGLIRENETCIASVSPQWMAEFSDIDSRRIVEALHLLGFTAVSQSSAAVTHMTSKVVDLFSEKDSGIYISSICPTVTSLIEKYHKDSVDKIIPLPSPSVLHSRMLKRRYGSEAKVVVISGCVAAKSEASRYSDDISAAITFKELYDWLKQEKIDFDQIPGSDTYRFEPFDSNQYRKYVVSGGAFNSRFAIKENIEGVEFLTITGMEKVNNILSNIDYSSISHPLFLDLYGCEGGCLSSPGSVVIKDSTAKNMTFISKLKSSQAKHTSLLEPSSVKIDTKAYYTYQNVRPQVTDEAILDTYEQLSIDISKGATDCGACGYNRCRDFAQAVILGDAVSEMCLWYQYNSVNERFESYIKTSRSGIFVVDEKLRIVQSNKTFASLFGVDTLLAYENNPGMKGSDISKIVPFANSIEELFTSTHTNIIEKDVEVKGRMLKITLMALRGQRKVFGIVRNMFMHDVAREEIVTRARQVINDNLATIQKIAYLLGDTASQTEAVLNSIIESQSKENE